MEQESIKVGFHISPTSFLEYCKKAKGLRKESYVRQEFPRILRKAITDELFERSIFFLEAFVTEAQVHIEHPNGRTNVKLCELPLGFFGKLYEEFDVADERLTIKLASGYLRFVAKSLVSNAFIVLMNIAENFDNFVDLNLKPILYDDYKKVGHFKESPYEQSLGEFFVAARRIFKKEHLFLENSASQAINRLYLWDYSTNPARCFEILQYRNEDFEFLKGKDRRAQKSFIRAYASLLFYNNLNQILKGDKND